MADRIVVMNDGGSQQVGTPHELYDAPANLFVAGFMGSPAMNFLPCTLEQNASALTVRLADGTGFPIPESQWQALPSCGGQANDFRHPSRTYHRAARFGARRLLGVRRRSYVVEPMGTETMVFFKLGGEAVSGQSIRACRCRPPVNRYG